ncbi:hypothetical protein ACFFGV_16680 [Pontibacillus salicampi]|uniref:Sporulation protein n=1 Tax=Pontibacillus salicampi TaxID=1449801 RepID=A0ABV6LS26_9BACI
MHKRTIMAGFILVGMLGACAQNPQGTQEVQDVQYLNRQNADTMEGHFMKRGHQQQSDNPKQMNQVGESWGMKLDKEKVHEAMEPIEELQVRRVTFTGHRAYVVVRPVNGTTSQDEKIVLVNQAQQAVENALPRYEVKVHMK